MLELLTVLAACSPPPPGFFDTRPPSGSTIPANAQIALIGYGWPSSTLQVTITQNGTVISVTPTIENGIVLVDVGALGLTSTITLFATSTEPNAMSVTADFIVDTELDTTPPVFTGIDALSFEYMESEPGLCWPGGFGVRATITPARDDWFPTYYQLYEVMPNDALVWAANAYHVDAQSLGLLAYAGYDEGTRCYVAYATDVAGNTTPEVVRGGACIDLRREGSDAGVGDSGDGDSMPNDTGTRDTGVRDTGVRDTGVGDTGTPADSGTGGLMLDEEDSGCGCTATSTEHSSAILVTLLLLAFFRRKN